MPYHTPKHRGPAPAEVQSLLALAKCRTISHVLEQTYSCLGGRVQVSISISHTEPLCVDTCARPLGTCVLNAHGRGFVGRGAHVQNSMFVLRGAPARAARAKQCLGIGWCCLQGFACWYRFSKEVYIAWFEGFADHAGTSLKA